MRSSILKITHDAVVGFDCRFVGVHTRAGVEPGVSWKSRCRGRHQKPGSFRIGIKDRAELREISPFFFKTSDCRAASAGCELSFSPPLVWSIHCSAKSLTPSPSPFLVPLSASLSPVRGQYLPNPSGRFDHRSAGAVRIGSGDHGYAGSCSAALRTSASVGRICGANASRTIGSFRSDAAGSSGSHAGTSGSQK